MDWYWLLVSVAAPIFLWWCSCVLWNTYIHSLRDPSCPLPLPPGTAGWPLVGEMLHFIVEGISGDFFARRRERYGSIYRSHLFGRPLVRVSSGEFVRQILIKEHNVIDTAYPKSLRMLVGTENILGTSGQPHRMHRKCGLHAFSPEVLQSYSDPLVDIIRNNLEEWRSEKRTFFAFPKTRRLGLEVVTEVLLGIHLENKELDVLWSDFDAHLNGLFSVPVNFPGTSFNKALAAKQRILSHFEPHLTNLLNQNESESSSSGLARVLRARRELEGEDPGLAEIQDLVLEMLFAGHVTTSSVTCFLLFHLGKHPRVLQRLRQDLAEATTAAQGDQLSAFLTCPYLEYVVKETLRLDPPSGGGYRRSVCTLEVGGFQIPKGWDIIFSIVDTQRYDSNVDEVESFNPDRWEHLQGSSNLNYTYLPFGVGPRACLGKPFAYLVLKLFTALLVTECEWVLVNPEPTILRLPVRHPSDLLPVKMWGRGEPGHTVSNGKWNSNGVAVERTTDKKDE